MSRPQNNVVRVDGAQTRYWDSGGAGSVVILLHGIGCSVLEWEHNFEALATQHRVIALDILGSGLSDKPPNETYSMERLAKFVLSFMSTLGIARASLIGNSMGGQIALQCAILSPERVEAMVLIAPAGLGKDTLVNFKVASLPILGEALTYPTAFGLGMLWRTAVYDKAVISSEMVAEKVALAKAPGAQAAFLKTLRGFLGFTGFPAGPLKVLHAALPSVKTRALVIWGRQDKLLPVVQAETLRQLLPNVQVDIFEQCGHVPQMEYPREVNAKVLTFLGAKT
jgi:pimeloyl-ACP methyl ester carboxylesterase